MKKSFIIICSVLITACGVKTKLSKEDLQWVDYKPADLLVFKSNKGNVDTLYITERKVYFPEYNPIELHDKYLPQMAIVKAKRSHTEEFNFVELEKRVPNEPAKWGIEVKFPGFFSKSSDKIEVVNSKLNIGNKSVYKLSQNANNIDAFKSNQTLFVAHIYLTLDYRILAYEMSDGELYEQVK